MAGATERRITAAAMRLFAERGTTDVTMSELAAAAGVARGTLYNNVDSVERLYDQVVANLASELYARTEQAIDAHGADLDPPSRLATGIRLLVRVAHTDPAMGRFLVRFGLTQQALREILTGPTMHDVAAGISGGRYTVEPGKDLGVASLILGATVSAMWMVLEGHQTWREAGATTAELVLCALGLPREQAQRIPLTPLPDLDL